VKGEFAAISAIQRLLPVPDAQVGIWIGDDAASVDIGEGRWLLLAADAVVAGVHADLALTGLDDFGWKAVAACVSDIAAMGGEAGHLLITVAGPAGTDLEALYEGIGAASAAFACPVVGGDLVNADQLVVTVAATGWCDGPPVTRSGARPGDGIWVTGPLGGAAAGLRHLREGTAGDALVRRHARPVPLLDAGRAARRAGATAMIDVSDGLAADVGHIAAASGVGIRIDDLPIANGATRAEALGGGEDFELVFCLPAGADVTAAFRLGPTPVRIGQCTPDPAERTAGGQPLTDSGWEHEWGSG
jgi:thiamine-monophosphate kinase